MGSRLAQIAMVVAAVLLVVAWFYNWASNNGSRSVELKVQNVTIKEMERWDGIKHRVRQRAEEREDKSTGKNQKRVENGDNLVKNARQKPDANDKCIGPDVTEQLRNLK